MWLGQVGAEWAELNGVLQASALVDKAGKRRARGLSLPRVLCSLVLWGSHWCQFLHRCCLSAWAVPVLSYRPLPRGGGFSSALQIASKQPWGSGGGLRAPQSPCTGRGHCFSPPCWSLSWVLRCGMGVEKGIVPVAQGAV